MAVLNAFLAIAFLLFINPSCGTPFMGGDVSSVRSMDQSNAGCETSAANSETFFSESSGMDRSVDADSTLVLSNSAGECVESWCADESYGEGYGLFEFFDSSDVGYTASGASGKDVSEQVYSSDDRSKVVNQGKDVSAKSDYNSFLVNSMWDLAKDYTSCSTMDYGYYIRADKASSSCFNKGEDYSASDVFDSDQARVSSDLDQSSIYDGRYLSQFSDLNDEKYNMNSGRSNNEDARSSYSEVNDACQQGASQNYEGYACADSSDTCNAQYNSFTSADISQDCLYEEEDEFFIGCF